MSPAATTSCGCLPAIFAKWRNPDRGYALAALTGALSFKHAKPGLIRDLIAARTDPVLFALSYDYVGDLSETVALMWPSPLHARSAPSPARGTSVRLRDSSDSNDSGSHSQVQSASGYCEPKPFQPLAMTLEFLNRTLVGQARACRGEGSA